jgi:hypothetical protein
VNALSSDELRVAAPSGVEGLPLRAGLRARARWWTSLWSLVTTPGVRQNLIILTVFWVYVACSNILYANSMQASIAADIPGAKHVFASYCARLVQHALLYPILLGCVWASLRLGWQSLWRKLPVQVLIALFFAALAQPAMGLAETLVGGAEMRHHVLSKG